MGSAGNPLDRLIAELERALATARQLAGAERDDGTIRFNSLGESILGPFPAVEAIAAGDRVVIHGRSGEWWVARDRSGLPSRVIQTVRRPADSNVSRADAARLFHNEPASGDEFSHLISGAGSSPKLLDDDNSGNRERRT